MTVVVVLLISAALAWLSVRLSKRSRVVIQPILKISDSPEVIGDYVEVPK